eukprot:sb/3463041/
MNSRLTATKRIEEEVTCPVCMDRFSNSGTSKGQMELLSVREGSNHSGGSIIFYHCAYQHNPSFYPLLTTSHPTGEKIARILPCHHTICQTCLVRIAHGSDTAWTLKCPSCRNESLIPNGDIRAFEVDFRVNRLIEVLARLQASEQPSGEVLKNRAARLRPEVTKSANALRSLLRQIDLAVRENNVGCTVQKKKVTDGIEMCVALIRQHQQEMLGELEEQRRENEQALLLQQEEASLELGNIESVLALEQACFRRRDDSAEIARQAESEVLPLLEVYSERYKSIREPVIPDPINGYQEELAQLRRALIIDSGTTSRVHQEMLSLDESDSESSLDDSGISDTPPNRPSFFLTSQTDSPDHTERRTVHRPVESQRTVRETRPVESQRTVRETRPMESQRTVREHPMERTHQRAEVTVTRSVPVLREGVVMDTTRSGRDRTYVAAPPPPHINVRNRSAIRRPLNNSVRHFSTSWGNHGSGVGQLDTPTGLCIVDGGRVAVVDAGNCRICVFNFDGTLARQFGRRGRGRGQLNCPNAIASSGENLFIADTYNNRISVHSAADGSFLTAFGSLGKSGFFIIYLILGLVLGSLFLDWGRESVLQVEVRMNQFFWFFWFQLIYPTYVPPI